MLFTSIKKVNHTKIINLPVFGFPNKCNLSCLKTQCGRIMDNFYFVSEILIYNSLHDRIHFTENTYYWQLMRKPEISSKDTKSLIFSFESNLCKHCKRAELSSKRIRVHQTR